MPPLLLLWLRTLDHRIELPGEVYNAACLCAGVAAFVNKNLIAHFSFSLPLVAAHVPDSGSGWPLMNYRASNASSASITRRYSREGSQIEPSEALTAPIGIPAQANQNFVIFPSRALAIIRSTVATDTAV